MDDESFSTVAKARLRQAGITLQAQVKILGGFVLLFWLLEGIDWVLGGALDYFGVIPRTAVGLRGILFGPFLHGNFAHLAANTVPFLILGWLVLLSGVQVFWWVTGITAVISGLGFIFTTFFAYREDRRAAALHQIQLVNAQKEVARKDLEIEELRRKLQNRP